jgi:type III pantothenate kinase
MLLAFDIGNTHTIIGLFDGDTLKGNWRVSSTVPRTEDEFWLMVRGFMDGVGFADSKISGTAVSSVVPHLTDTVSSMVRRFLHIEPLVVTSATCSFLDIRYSAPETVGADRLCNAVAGFDKYGGPLIVVDFGTATTFDVVGSNGEYLGGAIALGVEKAASILHHAAAKLTKVSLEFPAKTIGSATESSIQSGILYGTVEMVDGMIRRIWKELGTESEVVATGGLAPIIQPHTELVRKVEPLLVLDGLRIIYQHSLSS